MYMPGFLRTASNPSSFPSWAASYVPSVSEGVFKSSVVSSTRSSGIKLVRNRQFPRSVYGGENRSKRGAKNTLYFSYLYEKTTIPFVVENPPAPLAEPDAELPRSSQSWADEKPSARSVPVLPT